MPVFSISSTKELLRFCPSGLFSLFLVALLGIGIGVSGCAHKQVKKKQSTAPIVVGKVSLINRNLEFVLINTTYTPPAGTPIRSIDGEGNDTALLTVSQEKRRPFIIANIDDGAPEVGNRVIMEPKYLEEEVIESPAAPAAPAVVVPPASDLPPGTSSPTLPGAS